MDGAPPPPPPPHGENPKTSSGLPPGNYDIFIIPPHSSGSGFLYLPSLKPNTNSFIAGAAFAFFMSWLWSLVAPTVKAFVQTVTHSGTGAGMLVVTILVGLFAWYIGHAGVLPAPGAAGSGSGPKRPPPSSGYSSSGPAPGAGQQQQQQHGHPSGGPTPGGGQQYQTPPNGFPGGGPPPRPAGSGWGANAQGHAGPGYGQNANGGNNQHQQQYEQPPPPPPPPPPPREPSPPPPPREPTPPPPPPPPPPRTEPYGARSEADSSERAHPRARSYSNASASWQKAKEETKKREEERRRKEAARRKQEEEEKKRVEADRQAQAAAEKENWEKRRAREKEARERDARERLVRERVAKEKALKEQLEREIREKLERELAEKEALAQQERAEKEALAQKERAGKEALAQKEKAEQEAQAAKDKAEKEAKAAKEKAERDARVQAARERLEKAKVLEKAKALERAHALEKAQALERAHALEKAKALERAHALEKAKLESARSVAPPKSTFGVGERTNPYSLDNKSTAPTPAAMAAAAAAAGFGLGAASEKKPAYERPSAQSYVGTSTDTAYRPYDKARPKHSSGSSFYSTYSDSYAPSASTAPSTAPPSRRGPYSTSDPDKVVIKAVYSFSDHFPKPTASLVAGEDGCTDGTVLRITTEGMFVDDDIKGIGMREWDLKAWTMKSVETVTKNNLHIVRATIRDATNKNYVFVLADSEEWKVAVGLQRLKKGPLVRSFALSTISANETTKLMNVIGW